jgi:signal transduction histidine kinase
MEMENVEAAAAGGIERQLETFVALVAHEVRTPLSIVKSAVVMLDALDESEEAERSQLLAMVQRNVDLAMLLMDRMSLARDLETGTVALAKENWTCRSWSRNP